MSLALTELDPIASEVGHGAPGLRDGLRPFDELVQESASQKHVFVSMQAGKLAFGWTSSSGAYYASLAATWGGVARDVVGVRTASAALSRVETLAACRTTNDSFWWDDANGLLYVRLGAGTDPTGSDVLAMFSFTFGSHAVAHPSLGPEKLVDGGLEQWSSSSDPTKWSEGSGVARVDGFDGAGSYAAKMSGSLNGGAGAGVFQGYGSVQAVSDFVTGQTYRFAGWYRTSPSNPAGIVAAVRVMTKDGYTVAVDGRTLVPTAPVALANTNGERRRFAFDFVVPDATAGQAQVYVLAWNSTGGALTIDGVWFDGLSLRRIYRWEQYEPRISAESLPELDEKHTDAFFGPVARGAGTLALLNGDGLFEQLLGGLDWLHREFTVRIGGRFVSGGNEVLLEDCYPRLVGLVTAQPRVSDMVASLSYEDITAKLAALLPPNVYGLESHPNLRVSDNGRRKPLIFGAVANVAPVCVDTTTTYGAWSLADMSNAPGLLHDTVGVPIDTRQPTVYSYVDEDAAEKRDATRRVGFSAGDEGVHANLNKTTGVLTFSKCPRAIEITPENNCFDALVNGVAIVAVVAPGVYRIGHGNVNPDMSGDFGLLDALCHALYAANGNAGSWSASFDEGTKKVTISQFGGTFSILVATGAHRERGIYRVLGYTSTTDRTGSTSYLAESVMWDQAQHLGALVLRVNCNGYLDDGAGTYTGSANGLIRLAPDVARCLLVRWFGVDTARIDAASFVAGRLSTPQVLGLYLGAPGEDVLDGRLVLERIANSVGADVVFEREQFHWRPRESHRLGVTAELQERDYLSFESYLEAGDVFDLVRVGYLQDPASAAWTSVQQTSSRARLRYGRQEQRTFPTCLTTQADAQGRLSAFAREATAGRRRFSAAVKGALMTLPLGSRLLLTRAKGLDPSGTLSQLLVRLVGRRDNLATWESVVDLVEVVEVAAQALFRADGGNIAGTGAYVWATEESNGAPGSIARQLNNTQVRLAAGTYAIDAVVYIDGLGGGGTGGATLSISGVGKHTGIQTATGAGEASVATCWSGDVADGATISVANSAGNRYQSSTYSVLRVVKLA